MIWLEKYKTVLIGVFVAVIAGVLFMSKPKDEEVSGNALPILVENDTEQSQEDESKAVENSLFVDVKGAVHTPGLYEAREGDRVLDAIKQAGGLSETADEKQINFAQKLHDEMVVYVPIKGEAVETELFHPTNAAGEQGNKKVNINRADATELETLPGIGAAKAQAIIDYREQQGAFKQVEDIQNVSGIGAKTFEKLEESISVH